MNWMSHYNFRFGQSLWCQMVHTISQHLWRWFFSLIRQMDRYCFNFIIYWALKGSCLICFFVDLVWIVNSNLFSIVGWNKCSIISRLHGTDCLLWYLEREHWTHILHFLIKVKTPRSWQSQQICNMYPTATHHGKIWSIWYNMRWNAYIE